MPSECASTGLAKFIEDFSLINRYSIKLIRHEHQSFSQDFADLSVWAPD